MSLIEKYKEINNKHIEEFLRVQNISMTKNIKCLNNQAHKNGDKNPSMRYDRNTHKLHCFACGKNYDLLDLIKMAYNVDTHKEAYRIACLVFGEPYDEKQ